jgi:flagellar secretion chaperone FliS
MPHSFSGYGAYRTTNIETADKEKLIIIVYDIAINKCKMAIDVFEDKEKIMERSKHIRKAQDAINELRISLRMDVGEISRNLYRLYDYFGRRLTEANIKNDIERVREVLRHLEILRDAWNQAIINGKRQNRVFSGEVSAMENFAITG